MANFRKQINGRGYAVEIDLKAKVDLNTYSNLVVKCTDKNWNDAVKVGCQIFFEHWSRTNKGELSVEVPYIGWRPIDTTTMIVLYTTVLSLIEELDFAISEISFDETNGSFHFPK